MQLGLDHQIQQPAGIQTWCGAPRSSIQLQYWSWGAGNVHRGSFKLLSDYLTYTDENNKLMFCFWYNIVAWVLSILDSCVLLFYIGVIDLGVVAALIPAVYLQSTYIPHWKNTCQNATSWQVSNASDESWFTVLARLLKPADPDPKGCCEKYVETWVFTVAVM